MIAPDNFEARNWPALDRPFEPSAIFIPSESRIDGGSLYWTTRKPQFKTPRGAILEKFRRLHRQSDEKILDFVREFGVACFCRHGLPHSHAQIPFGRQFKMEECFPEARRFGADELDWFEEKLERYRRFSKAADLIVHAAATVNVGETPSSSIFEQFCYSPRPLRIASSAFPRYALRDPARKQTLQRVLLDSARIRIAEEVNSWVVVSQAGPRLGWDYQIRVWRRTVQHSPWGVLGAVALALLTSVPDESGWLLCSICSNSYPPDRPAVPGREHYCPDCRGSKKMWAYIKRKQRKKGGPE